MNRPYISFEIKDLQKTDKLKYDTLYDIQVDVLANKINKAKYFGFFVIYKQKSFKNYLNFNIFNSTNIAYGSDINFEIFFENQLKSNVIKDNILINWKINATNTVAKNGFNLPDILLNFANELFGNFNLTCTITYRKGTFAEKTLSKSIFFEIPAPPQIGNLESYPDHLVTLSNKRLTLQASKFISEEDPTGESFKYQYFYKNIFSEFMSIVNNKDLTNQVIFDIVPITNMIRVGIIYKGDSLVYKEKNLTVTLNTVLNYDKITDIVVFEVEKTIIELEAYSLNLRHHSINPNTGNKYAINILNKVKNLIETRNDTASQNIIFANKDKIATILEAASFKIINYEENKGLFSTIIEDLIKITKILKNDFFNHKKANNFLRYFDNILRLRQTSNNFSNMDLTVIKNFNELIFKSFRGVTKGDYKIANLNKINIMGTTIDNKFLKNDIIYIEGMSKDKHNYLSPIFLENFSDLYLKENVNKYDSTKISTLIPNSVVDHFTNDFIVIIKQYKNWNKIKIEDFVDKNEWFSVSTDLMEVRFINEIRVDNNKNGTDNATKNVVDNTIHNYDDFIFAENSSLYTDSNTLILNFTYAKENFKEYNKENKVFNNTSCIEIKTDKIKFDKDTDLNEDKCNTWFDYEKGIIQCECDTAGLYTVAFNDKFKYKRKPIQFPQTSDSIGNIKINLNLNYIILIIFI